MAGYGRQPTRDDTDVVGGRVVAQIIDSIIIAGMIYIPLLLFGGIAAGTGSSTMGAVAGLATLVGVIAATVYYFALEGLWDGYTVGKKIAGVKVVAESGDECTLGKSILRNILDIIDGLFYYAVGLVFIATSDDRQRLGDRVAGTVVVDAD